MASGNVKDMDKAHWEYIKLWSKSHSVIMAVTIKEMVELHAKTNNSQALLKNLKEIYQEDS